MKGEREKPYAVKIMQCMGGHACEVVSEAKYCKKLLARVIYNKIDGNLHKDSPMAVAVDPRPFEGAGGRIIIYTELSVVATRPQVARQSSPTMFASRVRRLGH